MYTNAQCFRQKGWTSQPQIFESDNDAYARFDFLKDRVGVEVQFGHPSFMGIDLLKFQIASYSNYGNRNASLTVRIPVELVDEFTAKVSGVSNVTSSNETADDITLTYIATESRVKALQTEHDKPHYQYQYRNTID